MLFFLLNSLVKDTSINIKDFVDKMNAMAKQLYHKEVAETKPNVKSNVKQNSNQQEIRTAANVINKYDYITKQDEEIADVKQMHDYNISDVKKKYDELMKQNDINELIEMEDVEKHFTGPKAKKEQIEREIEQKYDSIHKELQSEFDKEMTYIKNKYVNDIENVHEKWKPLIERQNKRMSSQSAGSLKKTAETVKVNNKTYKVYLGKRGGKYVKKDGKFLSVSK
jgi:hypothetical protein